MLSRHWNLPGPAMPRCDADDRLCRGVRGRLCRGVHEGKRRIQHCRLYWARSSLATLEPQAALWTVWSELSVLPSANYEDWPSGCEQCLDLWELSLVNKRIRRAVAWQATYYGAAVWWRWHWRWQASLASSRQWKMDDETMVDGSAEVDDETMEVD